MTAESNRKINLTVVGSLALDTVATPTTKRVDVAGGSVTYACAAAALFTKPGMVAVAGTDFPARHRKVLEQRGIDLAGLQQVPGRTFRWSGVYEDDMNNRRTLATELNVFAKFNPQLPPAYRRSRVLFLANIHPELQMHVLKQAQKPVLVAADTIDLWINTARRNLQRLIAKVDLLLLNDSEARMLCGVNNLLHAARKIAGRGPRYVLIKKGEHGCMLVTRQNIFILPAFPVDKVVDPTGAGDAFAGGMLGYLAAAKTINEAAVRTAMLHGTITASFTVEAFGPDRLVAVNAREFNRRLALFRKMITR